MNSIPKLRASIAKTGTNASDINCFKLNFSKNHHHHSVLSKKYISQNTGDIIIYIHKYIHLVIKTNHNAIIKTAYITINRKSNTNFKTSCAILVTLFK